MQVMTQTQALAALREEAELCAKLNAILYVFPTRVLVLIEEVERLRAYVRELEDEAMPAFTRLREALTVAREEMLAVAQKSYAPYNYLSPPSMRTALGLIHEKASTALATIDAALAEGDAG